MDQNISKWCQLDTCGYIRHLVTSWSRSILIIPDLRLPTTSNQLGHKWLQSSKESSPKYLHWKEILRETTYPSYRVYIYIFFFFMWGAFPGTFAKKCLFKSRNVDWFSEDVPLKNANWFLQTTLNPTTCFFKECPKCFLLKNAVHGGYAALQNDPRNPFFREHKSPHFAVEI